MTLKQRLPIAIALLINLPMLYAQPNTCDNCCVNRGDTQYCDASAGRYVCGDGEYSSCYCTRHAVMNLQKFAGCCTWQGGVMKIDPASHLVICNNGGVSEVCSTQRPVAAISLW